MSISGTPCTRDPPMDLWMNGWAVVVLVLVLVVDDDVVDKRLFGKHTERKEKREKREERREKREERREKREERREERDFIFIYLLNKSYIASFS